MNASNAFRLVRWEGTPGGFHGLDLLEAPVSPAVVVCGPTRDAVVLGSSQALSVVDAAVASRLDLEVVRRRSGGGAVLVERSAMVWFDVTVPFDHPAFAAVGGDVARSMVWLGSHITASLHALGVGGLAIHDGPLLCTTWSRLVCFAGVGGGEVLAGGSPLANTAGPGNIEGAGKLVGISQRRRRTGARFQCMVHTVWNPTRLLDVLVAPVPGLDELPPVATVSPEVAAALPATLAERLSAAG